MSELKELLLNLPGEPGLERSEAEHRLIEALMFSNVEELLASLDEVNAIDFLAMPVWLRTWDTLGRSFAIAYYFCPLPSFRGTRSSSTTVSREAQWKEVIKLFEGLGLKVHAVPFGGI